MITKQEKEIALAMMGHEEAEELLNAEGESIEEADAEVYGVD